MNLITLLVLHIINSCWGGCDCGSGGLCLKYGDSSSPGMRAHPCHCDVVSKRIYEPAPEYCDFMVSDYCDDKPCIHGTCYNGFGTFICVCDSAVRSWAGHKCDVISDRRSQSVEFYVWYPITGQKTWIVTISAVLMHPGTLYSFEFEDGRKVVILESDCEPTDENTVMKRCMWQGARPDCTTLQFSYENSNAHRDCRIPVPFSQDHVVYVSEVIGPVGYWHDVKFLATDSSVVHLNATYRVFLETGELMRKCPYSLRLTGCGETPDTATHFESTASLIFSISVFFVNLTNQCQVKTKQYDWYFTNFNQYRNFHTWIGSGQSITVTPYAVGFNEGLVTVVVNVTLKEGVNLEDDSLLVMCHTYLYKPKFHIEVNDAYLKYRCGIKTRVAIVPTILNLHYPESEIQFVWTCPVVLCGRVFIFEKVLTFDANVPCRRSYVVGLDVNHSKTNSSSVWVGKLHFDTSSAFDINLVFDPESIRVNPKLPLTITALDKLELHQHFVWVSPVNEEKVEKCGTGVSSHVYMVPPNVFNPSTNYSFTVTSKVSSRNFSFTTEAGPLGLHCIPSPDKGVRFVTVFKLNCNATTSYPPLIYYVYEGEVRQLVGKATSHILGVRLSRIPVWVDVEDTIGMRATVQIPITLSDGDSDIEEEMNEIQMLLYEQDFFGAVKEVDRITKHIKTFDQLQSVMRFLFQIQACQREECIIKTINSVRRILALKLYDDSTMELTGADDLILLGGGTIYRMSRSLNWIGQKMRSYAAYTMIPVLSDIHSAARELIKLVDPLLQDSNLDEDIRRIHYRKVEQGTKYARKAMAELGLFITNHIPHPAFPFELISESSGEKMTVISHNAEYINCLERLNGSKPYFQFTEEAIKELDQSDDVVSVAIIKYEKNDFWWSEIDNSSLGKTVEVHIYKRPKSRKIWSYMKESNWLIQTVLSSELMFATIEGHAEVPRIDAKMFTKVDSYFNVHQIPVPRGYGALQFSFPKEMIGYVHAFFAIAVYPTFAAVKDTIVLNESMFSLGYYGKESQNAYVGILANIGDVDYKYNVSLVRCVRWSENMWKSESCWFRRYTSMKAAICGCDHLSLFSVESSVPSYRIVPKMVLHLDTSAVDAWYAKAIITAILITILLLYCLAYSLEWKEKSRSYASFLDKWPGEDYPYLIAVYTGGRFMSGTSSHVAIRLVGEQNMSRVHVLTLEEVPSSPFSWGQDCWFILFTTANLGEIRYIEMWHDATGCHSDWYCTEIIIWDLTTEERFQFPVRTWLSYLNLYKRRDTVFQFNLIDPKKKKEWFSHVFGHFHVKLRQEHHWLSVFILHPRSRYTHLDRLVLVTVIVLVTAAASMTFYMDNLGPADRPEVKVTVADLLVSVATTLVTITVVIVPAVLFSIGRNEVLKSSTEQACTEIIRNFFIYPVTYKPIMTKERYQKEKKGWNCWVWTAYAISAVLIYCCIAYIVSPRSNFGLNRCIVWLIVSILAIFFESLVVNPFQVLVTALLVAYVYKKSARDFSDIKIDVTEDFYSEIDDNERLDKAFHLRVKSIYKAPLSSTVKDIATKHARRERFDFTRISTISLALVVILFLVYLLKEEVMHHHHLQLCKLFDRSSQSSVGAIRNKTRYFAYLRGTVLQALHRYAWYNGKPLNLDWGEAMANGTWRPTTKYAGLFSDYSTKLVGVPHLRQQRVMPNSNKTVSPEFQRYFKRAYGPLEILNEDKNMYLPNWEIPRQNETYYRVYRYQPEDKTRSTMFYGVSRRAYDGGGYVEHLHWSLGLSLSSLMDLELDNWLDNLTRSIFFTINLFSVYEEKISYVTIITECLPSGVYRSRVMTESASVSSDFLFHEKIVAFFVLCIALIVLVHLLRTLTIISKNGFVVYLQSISGFLDLSVVFTGFGLVIAFINRYFHFFAALEEIESTTKDSYTSLHSRFNQNYIAFVFVGAFSISVTSCGSLLVHNLIGFEAINMAWARTRALLVAFGGINLFAICVSLSLSYSISVDAPNLFFLLYLRDSAVVTLHDANCFLMAIVVFLILTRLNVAILAHFYTEAAPLIEPKSAAFKRPFVTLRSRLYMIQSLQHEKRTFHLRWRDKLRGKEQ